MSVLLYVQPEFYWYWKEAHYCKVKKLFAETPAWLRLWAAILQLINTCAQNWSSYEYRMSVSKHAKILGRNTNEMVRITTHWLPELLIDSAITVYEIELCHLQNEKSRDVKVLIYWFYSNSLGQNSIKAYLSTPSALVTM